MANTMSQAPKMTGNMHLLHQKKNMQNGGPKTAHNVKKSPKQGSTTPFANKMSTGDVVSDESSDADDESTGNADDDDDEDDEPDDLALSGAKRNGHAASSRLTGHPRKLPAMSNGANATAGAQDVTDEDDYAAVGEISDSDGNHDFDEKALLRSAEQELIAEFERRERPGTANGVTNDMIGMTLAEESVPTRRLSVQSNESDDVFADLNFDKDPFGGLNSNDDGYQQMVEDAEAEFDNEISSWRNPERQDSPPLATHKKVRFEEATSSRASSMSSDEDPADLFPDLFEDQDILLASQQTLRHSALIQLNDAYSDCESAFDFDEEQVRAEFNQEHDDSESASDSEISDSESDIGDTTDEETPEEQLARVHKIKASKKGLVPALGPIPSTPRTPITSKKSSPTLQRSNTTPGSKPSSTKHSRKPKLGTFAHDPTRASVTAGIRGGSGMKLVCPTNPPEEEREYWERVRQAMGSSDGSPGASVSWTRATPRTASIPQRPFTVRSTLGTMFNGDYDFLRSNDEHGIAKDLIVPPRRNSMQSSFNSNTLTEDNDTDESSNVNMADFVEMDDSDSEMDELDSVVPQSRQPYLDSGISSYASGQDVTGGLMDHFDQQRGLVSSFRNNQHIARHVSSLPANPARRAQMSEANALQQGRRAAANTPMTPARKKRQDWDATNAGIKKTASPLVQKHRRSRGSSLSGIQASLALESIREQSQ